MLFRSVTISGTIFSSLSNQYRINVLIDAYTPSNGIAHGAGFLFDANRFGDSKPNFGISAIQITASAGNIQIGASNTFAGQYTGSYVDDASGSAVTPVGFPGTTNAPAVVPNTGIGGSGPPTLGSASAAWPASFSLAHTLPVPSATAAAPVSGWVIYTDPSDGNKLKARYQDGTTIVTLGTP